MYHQKRRVEPIRILLLQGIIKSDVLSSDNLVHLLSICLFTLYHVRSSAGDDLEDFECIGKDEEV